MYLVTIKSEYYSSGTMFKFETLTDAMEYIETTIANGVPSTNGEYPIATVQFWADDSNSNTGEPDD